MQNNKLIQIVRRWFSDNKPRLHGLVEGYSVSVERIRQIEKQVTKKMRQVFPDTNLLDSVFALKNVAMRYSLAAF